MVNPMRRYRKEKLASSVRQIVGEAIAYKLNDPRVGPLTTVTRVEMTGDLLIAKVYLSVPGSDAVERRTLQALQHATGFLQRLIAHGLQIRYCPILQIEIDRGVKEGRRTMELLAENLRHDPGLAEPDGELDERTVEGNVDASSPDSGTVMGSQEPD